MQLPISWSPNTYKSYLFIYFFSLQGCTHSMWGFQAMSWIWAIATGLHHSPQQCEIKATSVTYTTALSNAGSLTHWARPRIKSTTSWFLVGFINYWAMLGTPVAHCFGYRCFENKFWKCESSYTLPPQNILAGLRSLQFCVSSVLFCSVLFYSILFYSNFLVLYLWHLAVLRLGVESEL